MAVKSETELYLPVKGFLEGQGYEVKGEVQGCDIVAVRGDCFIVVELKPSFNLELLLQGIDRQTLTETVYLAVEAPQLAKGTQRARWHDIQKLCRRLNLGLLTVSFKGKKPAVEAILDPGTYDPKMNRRRISGLLREFQRRSGDHNLGGSSRRPLVTAYREGCLRIACHLKAQGPSRPKDIRDATGNKKVQSILRRDVYGWFARESRGIYMLTQKGDSALDLYADVIKTINAAAEGATPGEPEPVKPGAEAKKTEPKAKRKTRKKPGGGPTGEDAADRQAEAPGTT